MASAPTPARRAVPRIVIGLIAAGGLTLTTVPAAASPEDPETSAEAAALVAERAHDLEVVTERFNEAREQLRATQDAAAQAARDVAAAEAALAAAREQVRAVARGAWTGDRLTTLSAVLTADSPDELLDRVGTLQAIADHTNGVLGGAVQATDSAAAARSAAERTAAEAAALLDRVAAQQADLDRQVATFQAVYDRLAAEEQRAAREAAERHTAEEAAAAQQQAAAAVAPTPAPRVAAAGGAAATAVDTALAQLGDPYVWAAAGPDAFDCSGLVQYAYAAAGVRLPHSSRMQAQTGTPVSRSQLQPGDLVFFYSPVSHVGIYVGDEQMVHASTSGQPVEVASIDSMGGYNSARRIG
ncbi:C40 family peptidase [Geodermatophilus sp. URMC 61]|uniref:C40 family peptidase n=1 Tax=Geodermatophilus sp. URMC 61 TaxID=3423411 RepID=UPI00406CAD7B